MKKFWSELAFNLKNGVPLPSGLHGFLWGILCHLNHFVFIYNASSFQMLSRFFFLCLYSFSLSLVFDYDVSWHGFLWVILFGYTGLLESVGLCLFAKFEVFSTIIFPNLFLVHILSSPSSTTMIQMLDPLLLSHRSLGLFSFLF